MKFGTIKHALCTTSLLLAAAYAGGAAAHTWSGIINNNTAAGSTEAWSFTCTDPATTQVSFSVQYTAAAGNQANPGVLTGTITKGTIGRSVMDDTPAAGPLPGPAILTGAGGTGTYLITVQRTTAGIASYMINAHCANAAGTEIQNPAPTWTQLINN
ncbi:MAG: hypothetical protein FIA97_02980 [Methylococcaceae bacterium]|nr:hypothetical protein [Methylococcaceae bacterium]